MEHSAAPRRHLPAKSLLGQTPVPGEGDVLDVAPLPFHDRHNERSPSRGRLLQGDGGVEQQVAPFPVIHDQPLPQIAHKGALGEFLVSPEPGRLGEAVRGEGGDSPPAHVVPRSLLDRDGRAQEIRRRPAPLDRIAHVHGEEPRPLVLAPHTGESLFPPAEVVRLPRFRAEEPRHLFGREPCRPRKPEIPHGPGLSLGNRDKDLSTAVFHVAGHRNGGRSPDEPLPFQQGPHGLLRAGKILLFDGGSPLQP